MKTKADNLSLQLKILNSICRRDHVTLDGTYTSVWSHNGRLVTTDGETFIFCKSSVELKKPVNCAQLYEAVRRAKGQVTLSTSGPNLLVAGDGAEARIALLNVEMPKFPKPYARSTAVSIPPGVLGYVAGAMSTEMVRYALKGVCLDGEHRAVAGSDGKRLHRLPFHSERKFDPVVIPDEAVRIVRMAEEAGGQVMGVSLSGEAKETPERIQITVGDFMIDAKLIQAPFPDYRAVFPTRYHWTVQLGTDTLRRALKDACSFLRKAQEKLFAVQFDRKDGRIQLIVRSQADKKEGVTVYPLQTYKVGGDLLAEKAKSGLQWFTVNPEYLLEALWTGRVTTLQGSTTDTPLLVDGAALVMPIKPQTGPERTYLDEVVKRYKEVAGKELPVDPVATRTPDGEPVSVSCPDISRCVACGANMKTAESDLCEACGKNAKPMQAQDLTVPEFERVPKMVYTLRKKIARDLKYDPHEVWNAK